MSARETTEQQEQQRRPHRDSLGDEPALREASVLPDHVRPTAVRAELHVLREVGVLREGRAVHLEEVLRAAPVNETVAEAIELGELQLVLDGGARRHIQERHAETKEAGLVEEVHCERGGVVKGPVQRIKGPSRIRKKRKGPG